MWAHVDRNIFATYTMWILGLKMTTAASQKLGMSLAQHHAQDRGKNQKTNKSACGIRRIIGIFTIVIAINHLSSMDNCSVTRSGHYGAIMNQKDYSCN